MCAIAVVIVALLIFVAVMSGTPMVIGGVLIAIILIGAFTALNRHPVNREYRLPEGSRKDPLEIAKERYANGEISVEDFQKIKRKLT
jgi:uncharacterized membrane protein